ncbi:hypothetical protein MST27_04895 [Pseudomonas sp. PS1]|uniref:Uncharacterized protein n=1 Tax=Stutzerimonas marianensis TaxID=2929513 RepID=A0A9X1W1H6_9GAMM|nr:hypothetical protein [Pseudomonas marianensis]MCJ0972703.1 hypothetical protein [Pseudomonas marianensis]
MSQLDMFCEQPFSILLKNKETATRRYDAIVLVISGLHFSCDLQSGASGERQLRIISSLAERAGAEVVAHGELLKRLQSAQEASK